MKRNDIEDIQAATDNLFREVSKFSVIALTGRTGSGCSTAARILESERLPLPETGASHFIGNEARKYRIIKEFIDKEWTRFYWLQVKSIITRFILELNYNALCKLVSETISIGEKEVRETLESGRQKYEEMHEITIQFINLPDDNIEESEQKKSQGFELYYKTLPHYSVTLRNILNNLKPGAYTALYQRVGDNIRASGRADSAQFIPEKTFHFASIINKAVKCARFDAQKKNSRCLVAIDALRNPYEAIYLRERYADFYVVAVNTSNENRLRHLKNSHKFTDQQIEDLDRKEYPESLKGQERFTSQDIQRCIELADIHINNPRDDLYGEAELASQLAWYVALILHPGLVMPTSMETCMQLAYSAKKSSGCISRQVGAVVTDAKFSIKTVGWNNSPQGQVPCLLRSAKHLIHGVDAPAYSKYERNNEKFREAIKVKFSKATSIDTNGLNLSYCFKDIQNEIDGEKNQVHTRSLHAEENAFLQIAKHGGQALIGGILFTTASPCELCAKKAFQLGISKIFYIDPYPGIATWHVLEGGSTKPELVLFRGAIGAAFHKLYQPIMPFKDELELKLSLPKNHNNKDSKIRTLRAENAQLKERIKELERRIGE